VKAQKWMSMIFAGRIFAEIARAEHTSRRRVQVVVDLAMLAPDILDGISNGEQPVGLTSDYLIKSGVPAVWSDQVWVTDITYIKTNEGWLYFCVVIDLFSRRVVGRSTQSRMITDLALQALLMAVWRRKPDERVTVHSDQGSQFTSREWQALLRQHNLEPSMSRRGNCHDDAVAESFFQLLKRERIRQRTYPTRDDARRNVFDYIEMFYNPKRKRTNNGMLSPVEFETRQQKLIEAGV